MQLTCKGGYYTEPGLALGPQALAVGQAYAGGKAVYFSAYDQASRTCALAYDLQTGELVVGQKVAVVGASASEVSKGLASAIMPRGKAAPISAAVRARS